MSVVPGPATDAGRRNNVRVTGSGTRPIVFAHGFGCDQNMWRLVAPAFEDSHRVVLFDHVGAGQSDTSKYRPDKYGTLDGYATDRKSRAREELCAEFGSALLGAMAGLAPFHLEDHASYIASWLELLRDEPRAFLAAGAKAQAAVDWLIAQAGPLPVSCREDATSDVPALPG